MIIKENSTDVNNRKDLRVPILVVKVKGEHKGNIFFGYAKNISSSGLFIQTVNPKNKGERFKIEFELPRESVLVRTMAEVIWKRDFSLDSPYEPGMGLKFIDMSDETVGVIDSWVMKEGGS